MQIKWVLFCLFIHFFLKFVCFLYQAIIWPVFCVLSTIAKTEYRHVSSLTHFSDFTALGIEMWNTSLVSTIFKSSYELYSCNKKPCYRFVFILCVIWVSKGVLDANPTLQKHYLFVYFRSCSFPSLLLAQSLPSPTPIPNHFSSVSISKGRPPMDVNKMDHINLQ